MAKPTPRRIPSDDCEVTEAGETFTPHEGEWIEFLPGTRVGDFPAFEVLIGFDVRMDEIAGEPNEGVLRFRLMTDALDAAVPLLARRIRAWSWTDDEGTPLPQPSEGRAAFAALRWQELMYLAGIVMTGESPGERKNGSRPSLITSSDTAPVLSPA